MKSHVDEHDGLRDYLKKMGTSVVENFEISEAEYEKTLEDLRRVHPKGDLVEEAELKIQALANTIWHRYMVPFKPSEGKQLLVGNELMIDVLKKILKAGYVIIGLLLLQAALAIKLHSQIDVIKFQDNTGATVKVFAAPFTFKAGANCTPSPSGSILTFNCAGGAAGAGGSDTQVQYNGAGSLAGASVGTYIVGSTKFKFQAGTHFDLTDPTDTTKVAEWDISQISAGATRLFTLPNVAGKFISATNLGTAGQMCGSNADGSCTFSDPIVSGPDAVAAAPTKNPVQVGCLFLTTPATLTNNQVGAVQCDSTQNVLVRAGNQSTGSTALGAINAVITVPLVGVNRATFQLQSGGTGSYTLTPQCSFDDGTIYNVPGSIQNANTGELKRTVTITSAQATTDYPVVCPAGATNAQMKVTSYVSGTANWLARATVSQGPNLPLATVTNSTPNLSTGDLSSFWMDLFGDVRVIQGASGVPQQVTQGGGTINSSYWSVMLADDVGNIASIVNNRLSVAVYDTTNAGTVLGSIGAAITVALAGDSGATFQLQSGGTGIYTVTPQCSFDVGSLYNVNGYIQDPVSGQLTLTATIASAQATTDYPVICPPHATNAQMKITAYTSGSAVWKYAAAVNNGPPLAFAAVTTSAPSLSNNTVAPVSMNTAGGLRVDETHVAGTAIATGNGVVGAGVQRVAIASDNTAFAVNATLSAETTKVIGTVRAQGNAGAAFDSPTGTAPPANAVLAGGLGSGATGGFNTAFPVSDTYKNINISTATTTLLVTGVSGRQVRIGAIHLVTTLANNVALIEGTGATCGTGTAGMAGGTTAASGWNFAANTGLSLGSGLGTVVATVTTGDSVCIVTSAATQLSGGLQYAIY